MIVARALAVPAVTGMPEPIAQAAPGQIIAVDGNAGRVEIEPPIPPWRSRALVALKPMV